MTNFSQKYAVFYSGKLIPEFDLRKSIVMLHSDLGLSKDAIKHLMNGEMKKIKSNVDLDIATEITRKFIFCGLYCFYKPEELIENKDSENIPTISAEKIAPGNKMELKQKLQEKAVIPQSAIDAIAQGFRGIPWGTQAEEGKLKFGLETAVCDTGPREKSLLGAKRDENLSLGNTPLVNITYMFADLNVECDGERGIMAVVLEYDPRFYKRINHEIIKNFGNCTFKDKNSEEWKFENGAVIRNENKKRRLVIAKT